MSQTEEEKAELKRFLFGALQEIIKEWQPTNAAFVNFCATLNGRIDELDSKTEKALDKIEEYNRLAKKMLKLMIAYAESKSQSLETEA